MNRKFFSASLNLLAAAALLILSALPAHAAYMDCLERSRGRLIAWDSGWDSDNSDNGVRYRIVNVSIYNRLPDRSVTLEMKAVGSASRKFRTYKVVTEEKARTLCERLVVEQRTLSFPHETPAETTTQTAKAPAESPPAGNLDMPFIRFTGDGWVRDFPPQNQPLDVCRVLEQRFSCLREERLKFSRALLELEEDIRARIEGSIP